MDISERFRASPCGCQGPARKYARQSGVTAYGHRILERGLEPQTKSLTVALADDTVDLDSGVNNQHLPLDDWVHFLV